MALTRFCFALLAACALAGVASAEIVTRLPTDEKVVALTFDPHPLVFLAPAAFALLAVVGLAIMARGERRAAGRSA